MAKQTSYTTFQQTSNHMGAPHFSTEVGQHGFTAGSTHGERSAESVDDAEDGAWDKSTIDLVRKKGSDESLFFDVHDFDECHEILEFMYILYIYKIIQTYCISIFYTSDLIWYGIDQHLTTCGLWLPTYTQVINQGIEASMLATQRFSASRREWRNTLQTDLFFLSNFQNQELVAIANSQATFTNYDFEYLGLGTWNDLDAFQTLVASKFTTVQI